jgi:hypothetical protein
MYKEVSPNREEVSVDKSTKIWTNHVIAWFGSARTWKLY